MALAAAAILLAGCSGGTPKGTTSSAPSGATTGTGLNGAGATFPYPIYSRWFDSYSKAHPGATVNYQSIGSGAGIQQLKNRTVDFGASDAPLSDQEVKEMPSPVVHIPTVAGAVVLSYNLPDVPDKLKLTPEAIAGIFLGKVTRWSDPAIAGANSGVKLPDTAIGVAHRSDGSGTSYIFTNYLCDVSPEWKAKVGAGKSVNWPVGLGGKGNEGVTGQIKGLPGGIGYVELAYALTNKLKVALVRNTAGQFVEPTVASTTTAAEAAAPKLAQDIRTPIANAASPQAYPICGFTYILLFRDQTDATKGKAVVDLLDWCLHDGQKMASSLDYAPLPESVVKLNEAALKTVQSQGKPLLAGR
jgi:phosphate transport system substrate-binding protein